MAKKVLRQFRGILTNPNQLELPDGALLEASNVSLLRPGVLRPRKGIDTHSTVNVSAENLHRLSTADPIVVHCRSGGRSAKAVALLQEAGFRKVRNLAGGILAWADRIDPRVPKY